MTGTGWPAGRPTGSPPFQHTRHRPRPARWPRTPARRAACSPPPRRVPVSHFETGTPCGTLRRVRGAPVAHESTGPAGQRVTVPEARQADLGLAVEGPRSPFSAWRTPASRRARWIPSALTGGMQQMPVPGRRRLPWLAGPTATPRRSTVDPPAGDPTRPPGGSRRRGRGRPCSGGLHVGPGAGRQPRRGDRAAPAAATPRERRARPGKPPPHPPPLTPPAARPGMAGPRPARRPAGRSGRGGRRR